MTINWYGQACFRLESKGISILIDPFSKEIGLRPPRLNDNIFLVTHEHYDHNNVNPVRSLARAEGASPKNLGEATSNGVKEVPPDSFVIRGPGEYEKSGIYVEGIMSYHDNTQGTQRGLNTIYIIRAEDMRLCHLGDLGQAKLTDEQVEQIGDVDILFIPVGGKYTIDGKEATEVIKQIEPKIIIPMHYKVPGLNIDLESPQKFLKEIGIKPEEVETYRVVAKNLPTEEIKLVVFKL